MFRSAYRRLAAAILTCAFGLSWFPAVAQDEAASPPTFARDIAPILYEHCTACHRPGQSAPFHLITYQDARKRNRQIVDVVNSRFMPPWLPEPGFAEYVGQRGLTDEEIGLLRAWVRGGSPLGDPAEVPEPPQFTDGWQLGEPDLVIQFPEPYALQAEGQDVFRNFVIPVPLESSRWVKAIEFRPDNALVVHHTVMRIDPTNSSRRRDALDAEMGFGGMDMGDAVLPDGHFLAWTPGRVIYPGSDEISWELTPGTDFIVQLHLHPSGKPELVQPSVGFYFTDKPPERHAWNIFMESFDLDIPAGVSDYVTEEIYTVPVDLEAFTVYPHAHYLGKDMKAFATLPDGSVEWLVRISDWDFNWQDEYRFVEPVRLPAGTQITMRYVYDNSSANVRNPFYPPQRVVGGNQSTDEMSNLMIGVLPVDTLGRERLVESQLRDNLERDPSDSVSQFNLAIALEKLGKPEEAIAAMRRAIELNPNDARAYLSLADLLQLHGKPGEAVTQYRAALELDPGNAEAHFNLGHAYEALGQPEGAVRHYREALALEPRDTQTYNSLGIVLAKMGHLDEAIDLYRKALLVSPNSQDIRHNLNLALQLKEETDQIYAMVQRSLVLMREAEKHFADGQVVVAIAKAEKALELAQTAQVDEVSGPIAQRIETYKRSQRP